MVDARRGSRPGSASTARSGPPSAPSSSISRAILAFDGSVAQFLLVVVGAGCLVAGLWNTDRHADVHRLDAELQVLEQERDTLRERADEEFRYHESIESDPRVAEDFVRQFFHNYSGTGIPVDEWIRRKYEQPDS